jgi:Domain of unknown function (DUF4908)
MWQPPRFERALTAVTAGAASALFVAAGNASAQPAAQARVFLAACPSSPTAQLAPGALSGCFYQASVRASRAARHEVMFETRTNADVETASAYADAATTSGDAIWELANRPAGQSVLTHVTRVTVAAGDEPSAELVDGALIITIVPARGVAGRPSAIQIEQALTR